MSQVFEYSVLAIIVGVPVGAVACAYRDKVGLNSDTESSPTT